jgi:exodeoxyribonuclease VII small subunit
MEEADMAQKLSPNEGFGQAVDDMAYDLAYRELEGIVAALESEDHSLEDALALYERGRSLARRCAGLLDTAELRVRELSS